MFDDQKGNDGLYLWIFFYSKNLQKPVNVDLMGESKLLKKRIAKPNFKRSKIFHHELFAFHLAKIKTELNRPMQVNVFSVCECKVYCDYGINERDYGRFNVSCL